MGFISMPDIESVGSALLITLGMLAVSISIVAFLMWLLYKFFKNTEN